MIERGFVSEKLKEFRVQELIEKTLGNVGHSHTKLMRTPLGEKIVIYTSRPGLVVGRKGANIKKLTEVLKKTFKLENPQIEISEIQDANLNAQIIADRIADSLERFGSVRFKGIGHKVMGDIMNAGARGVEILLSGKIPSSRARTWRFYRGYLKKCGEISLSGIRSAKASAKLKSGVVGIKVSLMPPGTKLPDDIKVLTGNEEKEEKKEEKKPNKEIKKEKSTKAKKKTIKKEKAPVVETKPEAGVSKEETKPVEVSETSNVSDDAQKSPISDKSKQEEAKK